MTVILKLCVIGCLMVHLHVEHDAEEEFLKWLLIFCLSVDFVDVCIPQIDHSFSLFPSAACAFLGSMSCGQHNYRRLRLGEF